MPLGDQIAVKARDELARFGGIKETREPLKSRIREYYRAVGANFDGGNTDIAWSAAFVSMMVELAGGGSYFPYNIRHSEYIYRLILNHRRGIGVFRGWNAKGAGLRPGDIIATNRQGSPIITFEWASGKSEYSSHCDIVTDLVSDSEVFAIGGNVGNTVAKTRFRRVGSLWLNATNATHQAFCLIRAVDDPGDGQGAPNFTIMRLPEN